MSTRKCAFRRKNHSLASGTAKQANIRQFGNHSIRFAAVPKWLGYPIVSRTVVLADSHFSQLLPAIVSLKMGHPVPLLCQLDKLPGLYAGKHTNPVMFGTGGACVEVTTI